MPWTGQNINGSSSSTLHSSGHRIKQGNVKVYLAGVYGVNTVVEQRKYPVNDKVTFNRLIRIFQVHNES